MRFGSVKMTAKGAIAVLFAVFSLSAEAIKASDSYRSPRNPERAVRSSTELIVLHTTEGAARGSLVKVSERGECHYCVTEDGSIYRIIDRDREAFHAGRSMWNGKEDVDKFSIGIECVGYHDKTMPLAELHAVRDLVAELKKMYRLSDDKVVCHSHVAYGAPNKWHKVKHRGRKQSGMLFAMPSVRKELGLVSRVAYDPDTKAKRLIVGDRYLEKVLYGTTDTMRGTYGNGTIAQVPPSKPNAVAAFFGNLFRKDDAPAVTAPKPKPKVVVSAPPKKPKAASSVKKPKNVADLKRQGYVVAGTVKKGMLPSKIVGAKWKSSDTYYTIRDKIMAGNSVDQSRVEIGTKIWTRR